MLQSVASKSKARPAKSITDPNASHPLVPKNLNKRKLSAHPLVSMFPAMEDSEYRELIADIREHGLREPIILYDGKILDGWHRYGACLEADIRPLFETYAGGDPTSYVVSLNLKRRHLTTSQRAMVAAKLATLRLGANQHTVGLPIGRASVMLNVSERSVARAVNISRRGSAALQDAVKDGKISLLKGVQLAELPEGEQVEQLKQMDMFLPSYFAASRRRLEDVLESNCYAPPEIRLQHNCDTILQTIVQKIRKLEEIAADIGRPGALEQLHAEVDKMAKRVTALANERWKIRNAT